MNKSGLIDFLASLDEIPSKAQAKRILDALLEKLSVAITEGDVALSGIGTFYVVDREARQGRNPQTGEPLEIPARKVAKFRASPKLKAAVNA